MTVKDDPRSSVKATDAAVVMERLKKLSHGSRAVVIINVTDDGRVDYATYGEDAGSCKVIGDWAQGLANSTFSAAPFQTYFGWGHEGTPTPLSAKEYASLTPAQRDYVNANTHPSVRQPFTEAVVGDLEVELNAFSNEVKSVLWTTIHHLPQKFPTADDIPLDGLLIEDLDLDSLDGIELTMACEEWLDITLEDDALLGLQTVRDMAALLWRRRS